MKKLFLPFVLPFVLFACAESTQLPLADIAAPPKEVESISDSFESLAQMETVFEGNYSRKDIQQKMDKALKAYKLEITDENYKKLGSHLIGLRLNSRHGLTEMQLLDCAIASKTKDINPEIVDKLGICASILE